MTTPLVLYTNSTAGTTLPTAQTLQTSSNGSNTTSGNTLVGMATGYGEMYSQGTGSAWPALAALGAPSGNGLLYDVTVLENQTILAGTWQQTFRLHCGTGTGLVADIIGRWYVRHSDGSYTAIGSSTLTAQTINGTWTTYTLPSASLAAVTFGSGDKLYVDCWLHITTNNTSSGSASANWGDFSQIAGTGGPGNTTTTPGYIPRLGVIHVLIGGVDVPIAHGTTKITRMVGQRSTGGFQVYDLAGSLRYYQGQPVEALDLQGNTAFVGVVLTDDRVRIGAGSELLHTVAVADNHYYADKRLAPYSATNKTLGAIANDLITQFLAAEGITAGQIDTGPNVVSLVSNYAQCSAVLDALVQKAGGGWYWVIDDNKALHVRQQTTAPAAPYTIDDTVIERDTDIAKHSADQYRNKQFMLGGVQATAQQTETRQGDGKATAFTLSYPLNSVPTVTLNGVSQTVGIKGVDSSKQWYWASGDPVLAQDTSGTKLISTDTLSVVYYGQFPAVAISQDNTAINTQQTREGGGTTGVVEAVAFDTTLTSTNQAFQSAAGYLSKYAHDLDSLQFLTKSYGFQEGQVATVNVPAHQFNNESMLVESVVIQDTGPVGGELADLYYDVTAVSGPINAGWQAYFKELAGQAAQVIGAITLGQSQILALLQPVAESWNWTEAVAPTVYTCFTFPVTFPKTFC